MQNKPCEKNGELCATFAKYPKQCELCIEEAFFQPQKKKNPAPMKKGKRSRRMGAEFEYRNHNLNKSLLEANSFMTPNSGAGYIKGDEQISGLVSAIEELKTKVKPKISRGSLVFTIRKEWLDKLSKEAYDAGKEIACLKFQFKEAAAEDIYVVLHNDIYMSLVKTLYEDRRQRRIAENALTAKNNNDALYKKHITALETKIRALEMELDCLKAQHK